MSCSCGCCEGVAGVTPVSRENPPGLSALAYRVGTYGEFFDTMVARLSNISVDVPSATGDRIDTIYPLSALTTREPDDPSIALLDVWACVADVLTFYQERIANEGYLPTALERRSVLELARLVGYRLRPGVSASVWLAFTLARDFQGDIPLGTRAQSIPGAGESPQFFETSERLNGRDRWNALKARLARPQALSVAEQRPKRPTDIGAADCVYAQGTATNLKPNDAVLFVLGDGPGQQTLRFVERIDADADAQRTRILLAQSIVAAGRALALALFSDKARELFPGNALAQQVSVLLAPVDDDHNTVPGVVAFGPLHLVFELRRALETAQRRKFTRLAALIVHALEWLPRVGPDFRKALADEDKKLGRMSTGGKLGGLLNVVKPLSLTPSVPPASPKRMGRSVARSFDARSDMAPRLIGALQPGAQRALYEAWINVVRPQFGFELHAMGARASLFASSYPGPATVSLDEGTSSTSFSTPPTIASAWPALLPSQTKAAPSAVALDATYDQVRPGSWVVIDRPEVNIDFNPTGIRAMTYHLVREVRTATMDTGTGFTAKVTLLTLTPQWLLDVAEVVQPLMSRAVLRDTVVYVHSEPLEVAGEPIEADVAGDTLQLDDVYDGIETGRWLIVSGLRTDIAGVSGVAASELVMVASVSQSTATGDEGSEDDDETAAETKLHTTLKLAAPLAYTYDAGSVVLYGNVAKATHGQTVGEVLGNGNAATAFQSFALRQSPLTYLSAPTPEGAASTLVARVNEVAWHEASNLATAGPRDRRFVTRTDNDSKTSLVFGNGRRGAAPPTGIANVKATYRYGIGKVGNVRAQQISQLATHPLGLQGVINPIRASGGADRDTADVARRNAPNSVMALDRLVSAADYAAFARNYAGIDKAAAIRISDGRRMIVHLTIAGTDDIPIDETSDLYRNLVTSLQVSGDPQLPIRVALRKVKLLILSAAIAILPDYDWDSVEPKLRAALLARFGFNARELGQPAFLSEAVAAMQDIEGVDYVEMKVFDSVSQDISADDLTSLASTLRLNPHVTASAARRNPTAVAGDDPATRLLPAELAFMTPEIPDTVILTRLGA